MPFGACSPLGRRHFERDSVDRFSLKMADLGSKPRRLLIGHDGQGLGAGWHLAQVKVQRTKLNGIVIKDPPTVVFTGG